MKDEKFGEAPAVVRHRLIGYTITCDFCEKKYETDEYGETEDGEFLHTLEFYVNPDQCVSTRVERDICQPCLDLIYPQLKHLLKITESEEM